MIVSPKRNTINVAAMRSGPNGIWLFFFSLFLDNIGRTSIVPMIDARNTRSTALTGVPAIKPSAGANLTSPPPSTYLLRLEIGYKNRLKQQCA
jgi:hypothetical protein